MAFYVKANRNTRTSSKNDLLFTGWHSVVAQCQQWPSMQRPTEHTHTHTQAIRMATHSQANSAMPTPAFYPQADSTHTSSMDT
eukprot:125491-Pelagomonas_calceolata.AAC.2